jgi:superfamily II DNA or RNA helicase
MPIGDWRVMLAMERTMWNRIVKHPTSILPPDLIIVDEGHFNNFTKVIEHFSEAYIITFTATPQGKHITKLYTDIIDNVDIPSLIRDEFLAPCKPYMMKDPEGFDDVKMKGNEFESESLFRHYNKPQRYKGVLDEYFRLVKGMKGIVFCVNVEHTKKTYETFQSDGVNSFLCHSNMSKAERDYNIREYESSSDGVMINCGILTTGYSHDPIRFIFIDRATTSLPLWLQMQGRGSRIHPDKKQFIVCDFGDNHTRLGLWNQPRTWSLKPSKKRKEQSAPVKNCPTCSAMLYASVRKCEFCGHIFIVATTELREGVMCEIESGCPVALKGKRVSDLTLEEIADLQKSKRYKSSYCWRLVRSKGIESISRYAAMFNYKRGWVFAQAQKMDDSKFSNYVIK